LTIKKIRKINHSLVYLLISAGINRPHHIDLKNILEVKQLNQNLKSMHSEVVFDIPNTNISHGCSLISANENDESNLEYWTRNFGKFTIKRKGSKILKVILKRLFIKKNKNIHTYRVALKTPSQVDSNEKCSFASTPF